MGTYNGLCYDYISEEKLNFFDAEYYCAVNHDGHLAAITSLEEDNFIRAKLLDLYDEFDDMSQTIDIWIGGVKQGANFVWTSGEQWTYNNWGKGQPDNWSG